VKGGLRERIKEARKGSLIKIEEGIESNLASNTSSNDG
jgi:hypothetical protein